jgi:hypothetical protein
MRAIGKVALAVALMAGLLGLWLMPREEGPAAPSRVGGTAPASAAPDADTRAEATALQSLRARQREPEAVLFREVKVWRYGPADERAVCGVIAARDLPGGSAPFVVRVVLPIAAPAGGPPGRAGSAPAAMPILEDGPGMARPAPEARWRFCRDAATPEPAPSPPAAAAVGAFPAAPASALSPPPAAAAETPPASPATPGGQATVLSHANLRGGPTGGEPILSVVPRGTVLTIFGRAPGGWVRVGEGEPWGWIHGSMLNEAAGAAAPPPR